MIHLLFASASAFEVPPFVPELHVVHVPAELPFRTVQTERAVAETLRPTYVIVAEQVTDGPVASGRESGTEEALAAVWDRWSLDPRFDPTITNLALLSLDERQVRLRAGTRWDAGYDFGPDRLGGLVDSWFLPQAQVGDLDGGLASTVGALDDAIASAVSVRRALRVALWSGGAALALGAVLLVLAIGARRISRARARFEAAATVRRLAITRVEARIVDLGLSIERRDRIVALGGKGERTRALVAEVGERLDRLRVGLAALSRRLSALEQQPAGLSAARWDVKTAALDAPFEVDPREVTSALFDPEARRVTIAPQTALATLDGEWDAARSGWARVLDAVDASLRTAETDLAAADLDGLLAELDAAGLPSTWVDDHPLRPDPHATWAALDALRVADPVAYLDALEQAIARDDAIALRIARLVGGRSEVRTARAEADSLDTLGLDTVATDPSEDPAAVAVALDRATRAMDVALQGRDPAAAEACIDEALEVAHRLAALKSEVRDAVATAERELLAIAPHAERLGEEVARAADEVRAVLGRHAAPSVHPMLRELDARGTAAAESALDGARAALAERRHLRALRQVREARRHHAAALQDLQELRDAVGAAERAETLWAEMAAIRHRHDLAIATCGSYGAGLAEGDAALARLRAEWDDPGDPALRLAAVQGVVERWQTAETQARTAYAQEQRRRAAAARAVAAAAVHRTSHGRATRSGGGYRSTASGRSSGRSAGRSSASSVRSAGRRF